MNACFFIPFYNKALISICSVYYYIIHGYFLVGAVAIVKFRVYTVTEYLNERHGE